MDTLVYTVSLVSDNATTKPFKTTLEKCPCSRTIDYFIKLHMEENAAGSVQIVKHISGRMPNSIHAKPKLVLRNRFLNSKMY